MRSLDSIPARVALALAAVALFAGPLPARAQVFDPTTFTLDNGLEVVVVENHRAPIVTHMVWYKVGAADEPPGKSGIAHFLEHLMFKGTETVPPGEFSDVIAKNGGSENAFTSWDYTGYFQSIAADRLPLVMRYESDRMANLRLTDKVVLPERDVILEERNARIENNPSARLGEAARAARFRNHPYGIPIIGWRHEMEGLTTEDALAFYERWYAPNNAILVVAGDVEPEEVRRLAEEHYGSIPPSPDIGKRVRPHEPPAIGQQRVTLADPLVEQPVLWIDFLAPSYHRGESGHADALAVLEQVLSGGASARLYSSLVVEKGLATSAAAGYDPSQLDLATFRFYIQPRDGIEVAEAEAALLDEIERLRLEGVTPEEVERAKRQLLAGAVYARDKLSTGARVLGEALASGGSVEEVETWPRRIEAVTADDVKAAIDAVLLPETTVTAILLPKPTT